MGDFSPECAAGPGVRARVLAAQGRWGEALGWAREQGLSVDDDLSYVREFEHITLARVLLARYATDGDKGSLDDASRLLERLLSAAAAGGRTGKRDRDPGAAGAHPPRQRRYARVRLRRWSRR